MAAVGHLTSGLRERARGARDTEPAAPQIHCTHRHSSNLRQQQRSARSRPPTAQAGRSPIDELLVEQQAEHLHTAPDQTRHSLATTSRPPENISAETAAAAPHRAH